MKEKRIVLTLNERQIAFCEELLATGLYGHNLNDVVERLLSRGLVEIAPLHGIEVR